MSRKDIPEEILDDDVADFIGAASAAKRAGKKKFTFGGKEYPVTISGDVANTVNKEAVIGIPRRKDAESIAVGKQKMGNAKAEEITSDARRKAFKEKLVKLGYKKKTNEERLLEKMGKSSSGYDLYHNDFSSAMKHAYDHAKKKLGIEIDPDEIDDKVAMGPRKPSSGKTNSYRLMGTDKRGKSRGVQIQVANLDGKRYELNMYKEEVELEEAKDEFKPHMMYDPKTGKGYKAEKPEDHERMKKLGYSHEKPEMNEAMKNTHALIDTADGNKVVAMASSEKGVKQSRASAQLPPMSIKNKNTLKIVTLTNPQSQRASEKMIGRPLPSNMDKFPTNVSASQGKRMGEELLAKIRAKHRQEELEENKKSALAKKLANASAATKKGKDKVTLKKAPWDKKEEVEMTEAEGGMKLLDAASELEKYAKKNGGIDKKDFMKAVQMLKKGLTSKLIQFVDNLDTEPREKIVDVVANHIGVKATEKMFKVRFNNRSEEVEPIEDYLNEAKLSDTEKSELEDLILDLKIYSDPYSMNPQQKYVKPTLDKIKKKFGDKIYKDLKKAVDSGNWHLPKYGMARGTYAPDRLAGKTPTTIKKDGKIDKRSAKTTKRTIKYNLRSIPKDPKRLGEAKQVLAHGGKGQYKIVSDGGAISVMFKGKVVGKGDFDRGADSFFISMKGQKGQKSFDDAQDIADYFAKNKIKEDLDEAISMKNSINQYYYVDPKGVVAAVGSKDAMRKINVKQAKDGNRGGSFSQNFKKYKVGDKIKEYIDTFDVEALIESADKKDAAEMKEIVLAMNPEYNTKQVQQEVEKMAMEKYKNKIRAKKIASHVK